MRHNLPIIEFQQLYKLLEPIHKVCLTKTSLCSLEGKLFDLINRQLAPEHNKLLNVYSQCNYNVNNVTCLKAAHKLIYKR